jgi:hypothetical protein
MRATIGFAPEKRPSSYPNGHQARPCKLGCIVSESTRALGNLQKVAGLYCESPRYLQEFRAFYCDWCRSVAEEELTFGCRMDPASLRHVRVGAQVGFSKVQEAA